MAKDVSKQPWVFDAADQAEGRANAAVSGVVFDNIPIYIDTIVLNGGSDSSTFRVTTTNGADDIVPTTVIGSPFETTVQVSVGHYVEGIYIETLSGTGATVVVFVGQPVA